MKHFLVEIRQVKFYRCILLIFYSNLCEKYFKNMFHGIIFLTHKIHALLLLVIIPLDWLKDSSDWHQSAMARN